MATYKELLGKKEKMVGEYERSKAQLDKQVELVRNRKEAIQRLEGDIAIALLAENGLTPEQLAGFLSDMKPNNNKFEAHQNTEGGFE